MGLEVCPVHSPWGLSRQDDTSSDICDSQQQARGPGPAWVCPSTQNCPSSLSPLPLPFSPLQVKIFEEDFQRERSDRERMNEEKEELKKQLEKLQAQVTLSNAQVRTAGPWVGPWACPCGGWGGKCSCLGPGSRLGQGAPGPTMSLSFLPQLKAFKDEEKAKEALRQQKRKAKVRGSEGGSSTSLAFPSPRSHSQKGEAVCAQVSN